MAEKKQALWARAELALWAGRRAACRLQMETLERRLCSEQEDVERMERGGILTRLKNIGRFEGKLETEKREEEEARRKLEGMEALWRETERRLPRLETAARSYRAFWEQADTSIWDEKEKELLAWCETMELGKKAAEESMVCMEQGKALLEDWENGGENQEELLLYEKRIEEFHQLLIGFLGRVGGVQVLPRIEKVARAVRYIDENGKTLLFMREGEEDRKLELHEFQIEKRKDRLGVYEALLWVMVDLEGTKLLIGELLEKEGERDMSNHPLYSDASS